MGSRLDELFTDHVNKYLNMARAHFASSAVQFGYAADGDFVIGDVPVITQKQGNVGTGPHQGVALLEADTIVMPLGPTVVLGLGRGPKIEVLDRARVEALNRLQWRLYNRWIACRPNGSSEAQWRGRDPGVAVLENPHTS